MLPQHNYVDNIEKKNKKTLDNLRTLSKFVAQTDNFD